MITVNRKEWVLLTFIRNYIKRHGHSPSTNEILHGCGYTTTSMIGYHLKQLEAAGAITRSFKRARTIQLCNVTVGVQP